MPLVPTELWLRWRRILPSGTWDRADSQRDTVPLPDTSGMSGRAPARVQREGQAGCQFCGRARHIYRLPAHPTAAPTGAPYGRLLLCVALAHATFAWSLGLAASNLPRLLPPPPPMLREVPHDLFRFLMPEDLMVPLLPCPSRWEAPAVYTRGKV